jgi:hypothetical protein
MASCRHHDDSLPAQKVAIKRQGAEAAPLKMARSQNYMASFGADSDREKLKNRAFLFELSTETTDLLSIL